MAKSLYLITQDQNNGYDTYDSAVVVAESSRRARFIHPNGRLRWQVDHWRDPDLKLGVWDDNWATPGAVTAKFIGLADPTLELGAVVCASYNAG